MKKSLKRAVSLVLATVLVMTSSLMLAGAALAETGKVKEVAVIIRIADMYAAWLKKAFEAEGAKYDNLNVTVYDNEDDAAKHLEIVENCISQHVDYIVAQTPLVDATTAYEAAKAAGIGVININLVQEYLYTVCPTVACSDYSLGKLIVDKACEELPQNAKVVLLNGPAGVIPSDERERAFKEILAEKRPDIEILDSQIANFTNDEAMKKMDDWLQIYPQIDGVLAASDSMAIGAMESYKANGRDLTKTKFYGIDGLVDACDAILAGNMSASALQDATIYSKMCLDLIQKDITGETNLREGFEPLYTFDGTLIDASNAQAQLDFYQKEGLVQ